MKANKQEFTKVLVFDGKFAKVLFDKYLHYMLYSSRCELVSDKYSTILTNMQLYAFIQTNLHQQCYKCLIAFYTYRCVNKDTPLKFNTFSY